MLFEPHNIARNPLPEWVCNIPSKTTFSGRVYEVNPNLWYPSVTTVLGSSDPQKVQQLNAWRQSVGTKRADQISKQATDRGTAVHDNIDNWLNAKNVEYDEDTPKEIYVPTKQIISSLRTNLTEIWLNEEAVWSHVLKTAGRVDLVGTWNGKPAIIDFKTASKKKFEHEIEQYFLQATTYSLCWYEITGVLIETIVIIIGSENSFKSQIFECNIYPYVTKVQRAFVGYHSKKK